MHMGGRLNVLFTGLNNNRHLLIVQKTETTLLDFFFNDEKILKKESYKHEMAGFEDNISFFNPDCELLFIADTTNGNLLILIVRHTKNPMLGMENDILNSLEIFFQGTLKMSGILTGISGFVERFDQTRTQVRIIAADTEGIKFGRLHLNQSLFVSTVPAPKKPVEEEKAPVDIIKKLQEITNSTEPSKESNI